MPTFTLATFNCENLFLRYKFASTANPESAVQNGFILDKKRFETIIDQERTITAQAILAADADIICLQEVENLDALKAFTSRFLQNERYTHRMLIDGNDPRLIDVAVLSRFPIKQCVTHQTRRKGKSQVFSRDCLEVVLDIKGKPFSVFVNHFKSMLTGKAETEARRLMQAQEVLKILKERYGDDPGKFDWAVLGDLNDYQPSKAISELQNSPWMQDVSQRIADPEERWTHFWADKKDYKQIDYIFLSKAMADRNPKAIPFMIRNGLCQKATRYTGPRFEGIGKERPHASDHCPVVIKLKI
ncbi:MAG: endonuclease/exonuclease/phosphatase family protein [Bacteroidetes bacterium]|nr:endonuclease/exonuclease/phosphatase family protein [Bacteroidota bacterium]